MSPKVQKPSELIVGQSDYAKQPPSMAHTRIAFSPSLRTPMIMEIISCKQIKPNYLKTALTWKSNIIIIDLKMLTRHSAHPSQSLVILSYHRLPWLIIAYHGSSSLTMAHHRSPWLIIAHHRLSSLRAATLTP